MTFSSPIKHFEDIIDPSSTDIFEMDRSLWRAANQATLCNSIYLFTKYNKITNYILIIYELSNFDHLLGVVSQTRVSGGIRTHNPHANSLVHYPLDYQGTQVSKLNIDIFDFLFYDQIFLKILLIPYSTDICEMDRSL